MKMQTMILAVMAAGIWGATASGATYTNDTYPSGSGQLIVQEGLPSIAVVDGATNITINSAFVTAQLTSTSDVPTAVTLYWGPTNGGETPVAWSNEVDMGTVTLVPTNYSVELTGLEDGTEYFYAYAATNTYGTNWAGAAFYTMGRPIVNNAAGATPQAGYAALNGELVSDGGAETTVYTYWGESNGATDKLAWDHAITNGITAVGTFSTNTTSTLLYGVQYYYRTYATNDYGEAWAPDSTDFSMPMAGSVINIVNNPASNVTADSATLNGRLDAVGWNVDVYVYYGTNDGRTVAGDWETNVFVGTFLSYTGGISQAVSGLVVPAQYHYAFHATNAVTNVWAQPGSTFLTVYPAAEWLGGSSGNTWDAGTNWLGGSVPPATSSFSFGTNGSSGIVELNGTDRRVPKLTFRDGVNTTIRDLTGTFGRIELSNSGLYVPVDSEGGAHHITADVLLSDDAQIAVSAGTLTIRGVIDDGGTGKTLTKTLDGALVLTGVNTYSGTTTISGGTLQIGDGTSDTARPGTGTISIAAGQELVFNLSGPLILTNLVSTASGRVRNIGTGRVTINNGGTATHGITYDGGTAGLVCQNAWNVLGITYNVAGEVWGNAWLRWTTIRSITPDTTFHLTGNSHAWSITALEPENAISIDVDTYTYSKNGWQGYVNYLNNLMGSGTLNISSGERAVQPYGTTYILGTSTMTGTLALHEGFKLSPVFFGNGGSGGAAGATRIVNNLSGTDLERLSDPRPEVRQGLSGVYFNSTTDNTYSGNMSGSGRVFKRGPNTLIFSGTNSYTGMTTIESGTLRLGADNTLTNANDVTLSGGVLDAGTATNHLGQLTLSADATAAIRIGPGGMLSFKQSRDIAWAGRITIEGVPGSTSLRVGTDQDGLTPDQLKMMRYKGWPAMIDEEGYVVPFRPGMILIVR